MMQATISYFVLVLILVVSVDIRVDALSNGDLRLVGGSNYREGRVEIYYNSMWGTICDDSWDSLDARVVCRQLGFSYYGTALTGSSVPDGSGTIWLDNVRCSGSEQNILSCPSNSVGSHNCAHSEDAGVRCYGTIPNDSIRLVSGPGFGRNEGRVEVYHDSQWKTVCDDGWGWEESDVVCKSLGYPLGAQKYYHSARYGQGSGEILLDNVECTGNESSLLYCEHNGFHNENCSHHEDVSVVCAEDYHISNVYIAISPNNCPSGYTKVYTNLNAGTKGDEVFLCYERKIRETTSPITGLNVLAGPEYFRTPTGYTRVNADINAGLSGVGYVYLFYSRTTTLPKISNIAVMDTNMDPYIYLSSSSWIRIDTNCNQGTKGDQIHIYYTYGYNVW